MNTDMDENQARQLEKRIQYEAPHLNVKAAPVEAVGWKAWAVYVFEKGTDKLLLQIEHPEEWEMQKSPFLLP